ncbi:MAG: glycosyltransferase [Chitinivibrionales bacterium]|nr:glycosyltransferase [Chitinivibrionales bacterium]
MPWQGVDDRMRALHFSYYNTVNVPLTYCRMYRRMGHEARLLTVYKHRGNIPEDICLHKRAFSPHWLTRLRQRREEQAECTISRTKAESPHYFRPSNPLEWAFFKVRDSFRAVEFARLAHQYRLYSYDIYHFHGGVGFFRDSRWVRRLASMGKTIVCNYHGPDLRSRGIVAAVDRACTLSITNEFDLLELHPDLHYIPIPYDFSELPPAEPSPGPLRIIHSPSVPKAKGTHLIEPVLHRLAAERQVEPVILTGVPHQRIIDEKKRSHIAIEQVGNFGGTGYGVNSLETLAMGIPTVTEFTPEYERFLQGHPFVLADEHTLYEALLRLIDNEGYRRDKGQEGRRWVGAHHSFESVWQVLVDYLRDRAPAVADALAADPG